MKNDADCLVLVHLLNKILPSNGEILFKPPNEIASRNVTEIEWTDGLAKENAQMNSRHWASIFIPIIGFIISMISYLSFHRVNKGKTALRLTQ